MIPNTILLVDDDPVARTLIRMALVKNDYSVIEADSSTAALDLWKAQKKTIHLLVTDLIIPGALDGRELATRMLGDEPLLPVIYISGHHAIGGGRKTANFMEGVNFLPKPIDMRQLIELVNASLHRGVGMAVGAQ